MNFPFYNSPPTDGKQTVDFDLNIENYSIDDLFSIYKIRKQEQGNVTEEYIKKTTGEIINNYYSINNITGNLDNTDEYVLFFNKANTRIIQHLQSGSAFINDAMYQQQYKSNQQFNDSSLVGGNQHVMVKNDEPYQNSVAYEYPKGTINPIERRILKRIISIDTLFRSNYDKTKSTDFIWNIPSPINNVLSLQIVSAQVPNMVRTYSNEKQNNIFTINLFNVNTGSSIISYSTKIRIPEGNYMADTFPTIMNYYFANSLPPSGITFNGLEFLYLEVDTKTTHTIIRIRDNTDTDFPDLARPFVLGTHYSPNFYFTLDFNVPEDRSFTEYYKHTDNGGAITVRSVPIDPSGTECSSASFQRTHMNSKNVECFRPTISPITGHFTHSNTKMRPLYKNAGWMMGFRKDYYDTSGNNLYNKPFTTYIKESISSLPITYKKYVASESSYGSTLMQYFFIEIDDYNRNFTSNTIIAESGNGTYLGNNILARIPITVGSFSIMHTNPSDLIYKRRDYFGPVKIEKMNIRLIDKYGEILDLIENDYSIAIELTTLY
jgi:hypothetical protein